MGLPVTMFRDRSFSFFYVFHMGNAHSTNQIYLLSAIPLRQTFTHVLKISDSSVPLLIGQVVIILFAYLGDDLFIFVGSRQWRPVSTLSVLSHWDGLHSPRLPNPAGSCSIRMLKLLRFFPPGQLSP